MMFELDADGAARRAAAETLARDVVAAAAAAVDDTGVLPEALLHAVRDVVPPRPARHAIDWVVALEALASASPTVALVAAGEALGVTAVPATAQWTGLRGADVDGLHAALAADPAWQLAVTASAVGAGRAAVVAAVAALKAARSAGPLGDAGQPLVADAATAIDASRLLLWDAAGAALESEAGAVARGLGRLHALESLATAFRAAERACGAEAFRPGAALERLRRDTSTLAMVLGDRAAATAAVAGAFPG